MEYLEYKSLFTTYSKCFFKLKKYMNNRTCISLEDEQKGPVINITINIPDVKIPEGAVAIKNYSENEGILEWLEENGFIKEIIGSIPYNWVSIPIVILDMDKISKLTKEEEE